MSCRRLSGHNPSLDLRALPKGLRHRRLVGDLRQPGALFFAYIGLYSVGRFAIEAIRLDSFWLGPFRVAQLASLLGVVVALVGLVWTRRRAGSVALAR